MGRILLMDRDGVPPVERQDCSVIGDRESNNGIIRNCLFRLPRFEYGQHVVPQPPKLVDDRLREVFIGVEARHAYAASFS